MKQITLFSETANGSSGIPRYIKALAKGVTDLNTTDIKLKLAVRNLKRVPNLDSLQLNYYSNPLPGKIQSIIRKLKNGDQWLYGTTNIAHEPNYNLLSFSSKTKKVLTVHDVGWRISDISYGITESFIINAEKSIKNADWIITPTETVKKDVVKFYNINPNIISVIPHGIEKTFLSSESTKMKSILPDDYWLFVGALTARKNLERAIEALSTMTYKMPLVIVGQKSTYVEELAKSAAKQGVMIILVNDADDKELKEIYKNSRGLIYPSFWEGFGLPIIEAAAVGTPIITSNNTAMKEIGEGYAFLVDPLKTSDIAIALNAILNMDKPTRDRLKTQGEELAKKYTWEKSVESHLNLYRHL